MMLTYFCAFRNVAAYEAGEIEVLIHQLDDPTLEKFDYYSLLKTFSLQADFWLSDREYYLKDM